MIAESLNMSVGSVFTIMTEDLKKKKLCARFVPHTLTTVQKEHRIASSVDLIAAADEDPNFLKTIVTGDKSWCLEYDPETKRQSSEWTSPGKGRPMKVRASKSKTKTMLLVFFDSRGIIHHEFLRQGSTVTDNPYMESWDTFELEEKIDIILDRSPKYTLGKTTEMKKEKAEKKRKGYCTLLSGLTTEKKKEVPKIC
ncbi:histone-lysine N-methyltransferase SETMAR [Nephila pilipes]|uniref:Histone-lysine N-methyltransferase SETMAR n=1 Tax=Nephila pilipes TaxID=299642 RepID=A0A8X6PC05_NEPPI|nr:histone-lysine N-methyltransferase SETMAR [Nephila pilipes]